MTAGAHSPRLARASTRHPVGLLAILLAVALPAGSIDAQPNDALRHTRRHGAGVMSAGRVAGASDVLHGPALGALPLRAVVQSASMPAVRYVANAGVVVDVEGRRFLIDAVFRDGIAPYAVGTPAERARIEGAKGRYADVDALLVTHWHDDHFDAGAVAAHLEHNPRAVLISSPQVVDLVRAAAPRLAAARLKAFVPAPGEVAVTRVGDVPVRVIRARHNRSRRFPEQHVAFLIGERTPVLHVGDADPQADNFAALRALPRPALAFLPFWYLSDAASRAMVGNVIEPRTIVAVHVPPRDAADVQRALREAGVAATVAVQPGTVIDVTP